MQVSQVGPGATKAYSWRIYVEKHPKRWPKIAVISEMGIGDIITRHVPIRDDQHNWEYQLDPLFNQFF